MAKSKKKPARRTARRRISGVAGSGMLSKVGGALVGAVAGRMLAQKLFPTLDEKIKGAAIAAAGVFLVPKFIKGPMGEGLAIGMAVAGGTTLLQSTGLIAGMNSPVMFLPVSNRVAGSGISQSVAGSGISQSVAGYSSLTRRQRAES